MEKTFGKIQHVFMMETVHKLGIKRNFLNPIKGIYEKLAAAIVFNDWVNLSVYPSYQNCRMHCGRNAYGTL